MNTQIKAIIMDDEIAHIQEIGAGLKVFPEISVVDTVTSADQARQAITRHSPHLLFLNIEMSKTNGIKLLQDIQSSMNSNTCIVFYSTHKENKFKPIHITNFDHLPKPDEDLLATVHRVKHKIERKQGSFQELIKLLSAYDNGFTVQAPTGIHRLRGSEVLYFKYIKEDRCWQLILANPGKSIYKLRTTTKAKHILNLYPSFFQISQDTILNIDYLASIEKNHCCTMKAPFNDAFTVSASIYSKLKEMFKVI